MNPPSEQAPRLRNAAVTQASILQAARTQFARHSYEQVGLREIAAEANVNVALVIRYFGSKERLFTEAVAGRFALGPLLESPRDSLGRHLAQYVLQKDRSTDALGPLLTLLRSASSTQANPVLRASLQAEFIGPLAVWLGGEQAVLRASLIAASLSGLAFSREVLRIESLSGAEVEPLIQWVAPELQAYIDGDRSRG